MNTSTESVLELIRERDDLREQLKLNTVLIKELRQALLEQSLCAFGFKNELQGLVNLHEGIDDGGNGITPEDWQQARELLKGKIAK